MTETTTTTTTITYRICYEDTDAGGIVYYGNYLRYLERGRNEFLRERGMTVRSFQEEGILFPVVEVNLRYRAPALYDDLLEIETCILSAGKASITFDHKIRRHGEAQILVEGTVQVACMTSGFKARRIPESIKALIRV